MPEEDSIDRESLNSNTVAKLRDICKDRGLLVSGKKSILVDRILEDAGIVEEDAESPEEGELWEEEALVVDDDPPDTREKVDEVLSRIGDVVEAEVVEAEEHERVGRDDGAARHRRQCTGAERVERGGAGDE